MDDALLKDQPTQDFSEYEDRIEVMKKSLLEAGEVYDPHRHKLSLANNLYADLVQARKAPEGEELLFLLLMIEDRLNRLDATEENFSPHARSDLKAHQNDNKIYKYIEAHRDSFKQALQHDDAKHSLKAVEIYRKHAPGKVAQIYEATTELRELSVGGGSSEQHLEGTPRSNNSARPLLS